MGASSLVVRLVVACSLEVHSFEACLCWRRICSRRFYFRGAFIGGALIGGDVIGCSFVDGTIIGYCTVVHGIPRECGGRDGDFCQGGGSSIGRE
jgi:hypothetical protein